MNELAYHCTVYLKAEIGEKLDEAAKRLERIMKNSGLDYQCYDVELRDKEGNVLDSE